MGQKADQTDIEERVLFAVEKLAAVLRQRERGEADRHGLYPTQLQILDQAAASEGGTTPTEVALAQGVSLATISDSLAALEAKGLITRERSARDARRVVVRLTARGRRLTRKHTGADDPLMEVIRSLSADEQSTLLAAGQKIIAVLQQQRQISTNAMCVNCAFFHPNVYRDAAKPHHCGYVDAPFGDAQLQTNCADFKAASEDVRKQNVRRYTERKRRSG